MNEIFRLSGGVKRDPAVDMWLIEGGPGELQSIAQKWFAQVRHCGHLLSCRACPRPETTRSPR